MSEWWHWVLLGVLLGLCILGATWAADDDPEDPDPEGDPYSGWWWMD